MKDLTQKRIAKVLEPYGIKVGPELARAISEYVRLLLLWNQKVNLTRIVNVDEVLARHFGESLFGGQFVPISTGRLADVGAGAGFPGLVLKILAPFLAITLIEPNARKATFLSEVTRNLKLTGVTVVRRRIESMGPEELRANVITSRAVGGFHALLSWSREALEPNGRVILWLGQSGVEAAMKARGWSWKDPVLIPRTSKSYLLAGDKI